MVNVGVMVGVSGIVGVDVNAGVYVDDGVCVHAAAVLLKEDWVMTACSSDVGPQDEISAEIRTKSAYCLFI